MTTDLRKVVTHVSNKSCILIVFIVFISIEYLIKASVHVIIIVIIILRLNAHNLQFKLRIRVMTVSVQSK